MVSGDRELVGTRPRADWTDKNGLIGDKEYCDNILFHTNGVVPFFMFTYELFLSGFIVFFQPFLMINSLTGWVFPANQW